MGGLEVQERAGGGVSGLASSGVSDTAETLSREKTPQSGVEHGDSSASSDGGQGGGKPVGRREREEEEEEEKDREEVYRERMASAKRRARTEIKPSEWAQYRFCDVDLDKALGPAAENIAKIHVDDYSSERLVEEFENTCTPCIIRGAMDRWPAMHKWTTSFLNDTHGEIKLKCGEDDDGNKVKIRLKHFLRYQASQSDDSPLYCFDADYGDAGKETRPLLDDFDVPEYFREDLFQYVGEDRRPPYRWLLLGPKRSGSSIHIDPLATSAWNAVVSGRKRWVLFPRGTPTSIIKPRAWLDREDHEAIDWFLFELAEIKKSLPEHLQPIELIQHPGEVIYVPGGWWHTVLNLEDSIAVTQNFCSTSSFPAVWADTVKGRTKLSRSWLRKLNRIRPDLYRIAQNLAGEGTGGAAAEEQIEAILRVRKEKKEKKKREKEERKKRKRKSS